MFRILALVQQGGGKEREEEEEEERKVNEHGVCRLAQYMPLLHWERSAPGDAKLLLQVAKLLRIFGALCHGLLQLV